MFVFFKQKTAYEMRISDWSSDVCSSDLRLCKVRILLVGAPAYFERHGRPRHPRDLAEHRALQYAYSRSGTSWRDRKSVEKGKRVSVRVDSGGRRSNKKKKSIETSNTDRPDQYNI